MLLIDILGDYIKPILFLTIIFVLNFIIRSIQEERRDEFFIVREFVNKHLVAHGMACIFAIIYICIFYWIPEQGSALIVFFMLILFYGFLFKIINTQNKDTGGNIESSDGVSGAVMYVSSALSPIVFVLVHALLFFLVYYLYKREDNNSEWKPYIISRIIDFFEAIVASVVVNLVSTDTFLRYLWMNTMIIAVFTLGLPFLNEWVIEKFKG